MAGGRPGGGPGGSIPAGGLRTAGGRPITGAPPGPRYMIGSGRWLTAIAAIYLRNKYGGAKQIKSKVLSRYFHH